MLVSAIVVSTLLPLAAHAASHSSNHRRHHAQVAARAESQTIRDEPRSLNLTELMKRGDCSNARLTYYDITVGQVACEGYYKASDFVVALNSAQYGTYWKSNYCGETISISYGGKTAQATIVDECPGCPSCGLDLTEGLFSYFADTGKGVLSADWSFGSGGGSSGGNSGGNDEPTSSSKKAEPTTSSKKAAPAPTSTKKAEPTTTSTPKAEPTTTSTTKTSSTRATSTSTSTSTSTKPITTSAKPTTTSSAQPTTSSAASAVIGLTGPGASLAQKPSAAVTVDGSNPQTLNAINWAIYGLGSLAIQA